MTDTLPPYRTAEHCPKCLCLDIDDQYRPHPPIQLTWTGDGLSELRTYGAQGGEQECLLRTCQRCGWAWLEACADATPTGSDPDETSSDLYRRIGAMPCTTLDTP